MTRVIAKPHTIVSTLLRLAETQLIPKLRDSVAAGNLPFGAAILAQEGLGAVTVSTNNARESPLLHGETNCIREFFLSPEDSRPDARASIFFSTHEPCSLCLSGIAWTRFPVVYYLFTYEDTRDLMGVGEDIDILEEVFRVRAPGDSDGTLRDRPLYNKQNKYFCAMSVSELINTIPDEEARLNMRKESKRVKALWEPLYRVLSTLQTE